ncbi:hypothetical protein B0H11DRAFT_2127344 [Mycena galericulata]|nr:hypothetical protein B0H11DRAFT_2127344 [Mycena galericulata]
MEIPQELVDAIIAEIRPLHNRYPSSLYEDASAPDFETLKSCTLVSRAFARPAQSLIFSAVRLDGFGHSRSRRYTKAPFERFARLLRERPHIASYVRNLHFVYSLDEATLLVEILACLPSLEEIHAQPHGSLSSRVNHTWVAHPAPLKAALSAALSCPTLRRVNMMGYHFHHARELHNLLRNTVSLKHLALEYIEFEDHDESITSEAATPPASKIFVDSLKLKGLLLENIHSIMAAFTTVDIRHLRSLQLWDTPMTSILRANAATLQAVEILLKSRFAADLDRLDVDVLAGAHQVASIRIEAYDAPNLDSAFGFLGNLSHLTALRTLDFKIFPRLIVADDERVWRRVDVALSSLHLHSVAITTRRNWNVQLEPRSMLTNWMPGLVEMGILHIYPSL